jgi:hypothetical protein
MFFSSRYCNASVRISQYVGVLISLWLFLFAAQPNQLFLEELKTSEQGSHKRVELRGDM